MKYSGSCLCGAVHYETDAEPLIQGNCHCRTCQKRTGSGHSATLFFPEAAVTLTGEVRYYAAQGGSGKDLLTGFCPVCGSQLVGKPAVMPGLIGIRAGTLDDPALFKPQADIFVSRAQPWDCMDPALPKFPEAPPRG